MAKWVLGLTGGIGSGKSTVSKMFVHLGIEIVDADVLAREVVVPGSKGLSAIAAHFGQNILLEDGTLNRAELRERIFNDEKEKIWLNALLHPLIRTLTLERLAKVKSAYAILEAPLLFENGLEQYCQRTLLIDVPEEVQIERTSKRDGVDSSQVEAIIKAQMARVQKQRKADDIIENTCTFDELQKKVKALHLNYLRQAEVAI